MRRFGTLDLDSRNVPCVFFMLDEWAGFEPVRFRVAFFDGLRRSIRERSLRRGGGAQHEAFEQRARYEEIVRIARPFAIPCISIPLIAEDPIGLVHRALLRLGWE